MLTPAELVWLIAAVSKGDEAAFERLYAATRAKLLASCSVSCADRTREEVIQEATSRSGTAPDSSIRPLLRRSHGWRRLRQPAIDVVRRKSEVSIEEEPAAMEVGPTVPIRWRARR